MSCQISFRVGSNHIGVNFPDLQPKEAIAYVKQIGGYSTTEKILGTLARIGYQLSFTGVESDYEIDAAKRLWINGKSVGNIVSVDVEKLFRRQPKEGNVVRFTYSYGTSPGVRTVKIQSIDNNGIKGIDIDKEAFRNFLFRHMKNYGADLRVIA